MEFPDSSGTLQCLGAGVRVKKVAILNVNVYAMALYAEPAGLKAAGGELLDGVFDKAMCLTLARDVRACSSSLPPATPPPPLLSSCGALGGERTDCIPTLYRAAALVESFGSGTDGRVLALLSPFDDECKCLSVYECMDESVRTEESWWTRVWMGLWRGMRTHSGGLQDHGGGAGDGREAAAGAHRHRCRHGGERRRQLHVGGGGGGGGACHGALHPRMNVLPVWLCAVVCCVTACRDAFKLLVWRCCSSGWRVQEH